MDEEYPDFRDAIHTHGIEPPDIIEPGKFYRFPGHGKGPHNRAGWCVLFADEQGGSFGDWSSGLSETWQKQCDWPYSPAERAEFRRKIKEAHVQAKRERAREQTKAAKRAEAIWNAAKLAPAIHPYLIKKHIQPHGARLYKRLLVLAVMDFDGALTSLQFIAPDGTKNLLRNGRKQGRFIPIDGNPPPTIPSRLIICEGFATGCTLAEDEPASTVLAAIDAGNLEPVAVAARHRWPSVEIVIAGDDDRRTEGNPGATKARTAALAARALLALPPWPEGCPELSDFNDLALWLAGGAS